MTVAREPEVRATGFEAYLLDQVQAAVVATDLTGAISHWNRHATALFGWTAEEAVSRPIADLTEPGPLVADRMTADEGWEGQVAILRKDGSTVVCHATHSPIRDEGGDLFGFAGVFVDISERTRAERALALQYAVTRALADADSMEDAAPGILEGVCRTLGWEIGCIWMIDREVDSLRCVATWQVPASGATRFETASRSYRFPPGIGLPGRVWMTARPVWIPDLMKDESFPRAPIAAEEDLHSGVGFPIELRGYVLGVLEFFSHSIREPDREILSMMTAVGSQIGQFLERKDSEEAVRRSEARKTAILQSTLDCIVTMDHEGRVVEVNPATERTFGYERSEVVGRELAELFIPPRLRERHRAGLARYLATGRGPILGTHTEVTASRADGTEFPAEITVNRVDLPGPPLFTGYIRDITEQKRAVEELRRSRDQLEAIFQGVSEGLTVQDATGHVIYANETGARLCGYPDAQAMIADERPPHERFELEDELGRPLPAERLPGKRALRGETSEAQVLFRRVGSKESRWAIIRATPILDDRGTVQLAVSIFHDVTDRRRRLDKERFLAEATTLLNASLDYEETLTKLAWLTVPHVADWCSVDILEPDGSIRPLAVAHVDPRKIDAARALRERYPGDPRRPSPLSRVIRTGEPEIIPLITEQRILEGAPDQQFLDMVRDLGLVSMMILPLRARGRGLGAITFVHAESGRRYGADDLAFAMDLARRASLAIDNARLYRERDRIARTLQRSLVPPSLPAIPGFELEGRYRFAGPGSEVGGDFYDAFDTGDGAWAMVIGDVCGKGPEAAVITGLARHTIRAAAVHQRKPSMILETLNEAIYQQGNQSNFCTVAHVRVRPGRRSARLTLCCAGHPLPLVLRGDGTVETAGTPGTLLGVFHDPELHDEAVDLGPGDSLVLVTDGVIEERGEGDVFGRNRLASLLASLADRDAAGIADSIEKAIESFSAGDPRDDQAILVLRVVPVRR